MEMKFLFHTHLHMRPQISINVFFFLSFSDFYHMILFLLYENYSNLLVCIFSIEKNSFENSYKFYEVADICVTKVSYCHTDIELYYESKSEA